VLLPELGDEAAIAKRFQQEAQSVSRLEHPGIIQVFDFGHTEEGQLFLAMAYLDGLSLTQVIHREAPVPPERAIPLAIQICEALHHAHLQGVVHRDLKPDNVMILQRDDLELVKLLDFGIARITQGEGAAKGMTEVGMVFGTPEYLSPEQAAGDPADPRSDLYAAGLMIYEMLAGRRPFVAETNVRYISMHLHEAPPPLREAAPHLDLPASLEAVVMKALAKSPEERHPTGRAFAEALMALQLAPRVSHSMLPALTTVPPRATSAPFAEPGGAAPPGSSAPQVDAPASGPSPVPGQEPPALARALKVWGLVGLGVLLFLLVVLLAVIAGSDDDGPEDRAPEGATLPEEDGGGVRKDLDVATELQAAEGLLSVGQLSQAAEKLKRARQQAPRHPRVHLLQGHLHCRQGNQAACLASYQSAILLDASLREDPGLLEQLGKLLRRRKGRRWGRPAREAAVTFVVGTFAGAGPLGKRSRRLLRKWVNKWWEHDLVWRVVDTLAARGADEEVDYVHAYRVRFRGVRSCDTRKRYISEMVRRGDKAFIPLLKEIYEKASFRKPYSRRRIPNECIQDAAAEAIVKLGGTPPIRTSRAMDARSRRN
jgi:serine/threonine-protein kinase